MFIKLQITYFQSLSKNISYKTKNSEKHLCLIFNKINGCIEESNGKKYLTLVLTDETKDKLRKYKSMKKY